jgi:cell division protein FtsL
MKQRSLFIFCLILVSAVCVVSQTVTNTDLAKYREQRLAAERDYRDNYVRLGMPSPAEIERKREESRIATEQLSAKLRSERLERERIEAYREAELIRAAQYNRQLRAEQQAFYSANPGYFVSYGAYGGLGYNSFGNFGIGFGNFRPRHFRRPFRHYQQTGYYGGGQFWPTGTVRPQAAPMLIQRRR